VSGVDLDGLWRVAERAARAGAAVVSDAYARVRGPAESKGRVGDYVSDVDRQSEAAIRDALAAGAPGIPVLGEEAGGERGDVFWAVDPLDATTNFLIGFPVVSVSVALVEGGRPVVGVVEAPVLGSRFSGARSRGAWCGDERLAASRRPPERAVVATAFPFRVRHRMREYRPVFDGVFERVEDIRRAGSAALDLAWTAAGVWDGFFELNLEVWDVAAGALLVEEAGGLVTDWDGGTGFLEGDVLAGSRRTHTVLLERAARRG
jgi:myo-inositol-1(or 4)-monophosphatase